MTADDDECMTLNVMEAQLMRQHGEEFVKWLKENRPYWFGPGTDTSTYAKIMEGGKESLYQMAWDEWHASRYES